MDKLAVTEKSSFDDYLATTKRELAKSLTRILKTDTKLDAQNTQYSPVKGRTRKAWLQINESISKIPEAIWNYFFK